MIRKAFAFVLALIICCSLHALDNGVSFAVEGACSGVVAAVISQTSEPRISLQGVTFSYSEGAVPESISFVRSDVSTYKSSLRFFADPERSVYLDSIWAGLAELLSDDEPFLFDEIAEGDVILDGAVRISYEDGSATLALSLLVTGNIIGDGVVIEGELHIAISDGTATVMADDLMIDGDPYVVPELSFALPGYGG